MRLSGILYVYEARLEARGALVQEGFAILGIAVGVALLFASQISSTSLARSVAQLNDQLVGSAQVQLTARGPEGVSEQLLTAVRRVPGVQVALPIFERQVNVIGPGGAEQSVDLIGVQPRSVRASGPLLRRFSSKALDHLRAIALPLPLAHEIGVGPLETVRLQVGARFVHTLVGATLSEEYIGGLVHSPVAVTSIGYAQSLTGAQGQINRIFVRYSPDRSREVRAALSRVAAAWNVNFESSQADSRLFNVAVAPQSKSEELFSGISALVGFMFALNAMLITVPARRRLIENIRPHGATRAMTVQILLFDALVIGMLACALGLVLGDALSIAVFNTKPGYLAFAFPIGDNRIVTWQSVAIAVFAGMAAAVVGVLWPLRQVLARPSRSPFHSPDSQATWRMGRLALGVVCVAVTTITLVADTSEALVGNVALVLGLVCLLPFLFDAVVVCVGWVSDLLDGVASELAVTELQAPQTRVRSLAIAATVAVAVFGVVEFQGTQSNLERGLAASIRGTDSTAALWVLPSGRSSIQPTVAFQSTDAATLAHVPGVASVGVYRGSFLDWGNRRLWVIAPAANAEHPVPADQVLAGRVSAATERVRGGGWAVIAQALATEHHLHVGQAFTLPSPRPLSLRVAAVSTNLAWPPGAIILSSSDYARGWSSANPSAYQIQTLPGASLAEVDRLVRHALSAQPGLTVETSAQREQRHYAVAAQGLSRLTQIRLLVLIAAILAVVGAMGAMIWQRRDRIAAMKCHGYTERIVWRWLLCESAILLAAGCSIGAVFGLYAQLLGSHFLATVTGFPVVFDIEGVAAISSFAIVTLTALAVVAIPGYAIARVPPRAASPAY